MQKNKKGNLQVHALHTEPQDTRLPGWLQIGDLIASTCQTQATVLEPAAEIAWDDWVEVKTLPREIGQLADVQEVRLYGSHLYWLPPEIGRMTRLKNLDIYTSYSLHWLPYEIMRCKNLTDTRMSTRALYGNKNSRLPFPPLHKPVEQFLPDTCSVCDRPFGETLPTPYWMTLRVGTDITPLLLHSCSHECTKSVPSAPNGYHERPHKGGGGVGMPSL